MTDEHLLADARDAVALVEKRRARTGCKPRDGDRLSIAGALPAHALGHCSPSLAKRGSSSAAVPSPRGEDMTVLTADPLHGDKVVHNRWGFRGDEGPIVTRRFVGTP